jgi:hypothetical protein
MTRMLLASSLLLVAVACDEGAKPTPTPTSPSSAPAATAKATSTATADTGATKPAMSDDPLDKEDIPVAADFEDEAEKDITDDNFDDEIDKLDHEIGDKK